MCLWPHLWLFIQYLSFAQGLRPVRVPLRWWGIQSNIGDLNNPIFSLRLKMDSEQSFNTGAFDDIWFQHLPFSFNSLFYYWIFGSYHYLFFVLTYAWPILKKVIRDCSYNLSYLHQSYCASPNLTASGYHHVKCSTVAGRSIKKEED